MARRLVAEGDRVFVTLDYGKDVEIVDAATGNSLGKVPGTGGSEEILVDGNQLVCISQVSPRRSDARVVITCYDIDAGEVAWQYMGDGHYTPQLPCVGKDSVVYHKANQIICINRADGNVRWKIEAGKIISQSKLDAMPIFDGMIVADWRLYLSTESGDVICMGGK